MPQSLPFEVRALPVVCLAVSGHVVAAVVVAADRDPDIVPVRRLSLDDGPLPMLRLAQYQPTELTVENHGDQAVVVHWPAFEIDTDFDGGHEWRTHGVRRTPPIPPNGRYSVRLTALHAGRFSYAVEPADDGAPVTGRAGLVVVAAAATR